MQKLLLILAGVLVLAGCSGQRVLNNLTPSTGYQVGTNFIYDTATGNRLDVYTPNGAKNAPVVVFFYGGRWNSGSKDEYKFVGQALASSGFVVVIPDYQLYPKVRFPTFIEDGAKAVKWTHDNIAQYGGAQGRVFLMGHSSGGQIAAMLALNESYLKAVGGSRTWLRGMIGLAGAYDFLPITDPELRDIFGPPERFEQSQPILFADGTNPPILLMHGEDDQVVQVKNTRNLANAISRSGGQVETVIYPKMSHGYMVGALGPVLRSRYDVLQNIDAFIRKWVNATRVETNIETTPLNIESTPLQ